MTASPTPAALNPFLDTESTRSARRPGIITAVYGSRSLPRDLPLCRATLARLFAAAGGAENGGASRFGVMLHTTPDPTDAPPVRDLRASGIERVWIGVPANPYVRLKHRSGMGEVITVVRQHARYVRDWGCEVMMFNGEANSADRDDDWSGDTPEEAAEIDALAREMLAAAKDAAPEVAMAWTSHDHPTRFRTPNAAVLGAASPVVIHAPQTYADNPYTPGQTPRAEAEHRLLGASEKWRAEVAKGVVRGDVGPDGPGFAPYVQLHGVSAQGTVAMLAPHALGCAWALPERADADGLTALLWTLRMRAAHGDAAGYIARWQAAQGLDADGVFGGASEARARELYGAF